MDIDNKKIDIELGDERLIDDFDNQNFYIIRNISKIRNIILEKYKNIHNGIDDNFVIGRSLDLISITFSFQNSYFLFSTVDKSTGDFLLDCNMKTVSYKTSIPKSLLDDIDNNSYSDVEICLKYGRDFLDTNILDYKNLILTKELFSIIG